MRLPNFSICSCCGLLDSKRRELAFLIKDWPLRCPSKSLQGCTIWGRAEDCPGHRLLGVGCGPNADAILQAKGACKLVPLLLSLLHRGKSRGGTWQKRTTTPRPTTTTTTPVDRTCRTCADLRKGGDEESGLKDVVILGRRLKALCDMADGGTVILS